MKNGIRGMGMKLVGFIGVMLWLCTGCGMKNDAGDAPEPAAASGSAGKVSAHIAEASERNPLCNGVNYYESVYGKDDDDWTVCQMNMDGTTRQEFPMKKYGSLIYVRENELFYLTQNSGLEAVKIWCVPILHSDSGDVPQFDKAKKLFTDKRNTAIHEGNFYANDRYILYITDIYDLRVYDRNAGKFLPIQDVADKKGPANDGDPLQNSMIGDTLFVGCKYSGLYSYTLGDKKLKQINKRTHGSYSVLICPEQNLVLYEDCKGCDGKNHGPIVLCRYDCKTGEKKEFMTGEKWKQVYVDTGAWEKYQKAWCQMEKEYMELDEEKRKAPRPEDAPYPEPAYFLDGTRLYAMESGGIVLSLDLAGNAVPCYEKGLSECMRAHKYESYDVVKVDQGVCYFDYEEEESEKHTYGYYDPEINKYVQTKVEDYEE